MSYKVKLEVFEGPLDLLLHLIQKQELDIKNIPIAEITEQYLDYLWAMEQLDLGIASEFLVMGATLLSIKAKMLLPRPPVSEEEPTSLVDPREELVVRLLEYQKYKAVIEKLREKEIQQHLIFDHPFDFEGFLSGLVPENPLRNISPWDLFTVYKQVLEEASYSEPVHRLNQEIVTVGKQMETILELLTMHQDGMDFCELFPREPSPTMIVVTFLALLELLRLGKLEICQKEIFGHIRIFPYQEPLAGGGCENVVCR